MMYFIQMSDLHSRIRIELLARGILDGRQLREALGVSQPTLSRTLASFGDHLIRIGRTRASRYGLPSPVRDLGHAWPLYRIDEGGAPRELGTLHSLAGRAWWLDATAGALPPALTGEEFQDGIFPGLPWFLDDMRPQGFLGRAFARAYGTALGEGTDPATWSEPGVAASLLLHGSDLPGAFVLGKEALATALSRHGHPLPASERALRYPGLAEAALGGSDPGSSAGGEQSKFLARVTDDGTASIRDVLVKFSAPVSTPEGRRWSDLLACEAIASSVLGRNGFPVPAVEILDAGGRRFLEVTRFDRTGTGGRRACVSLRAHDAAFFGEQHTTWDRAAGRMVASGWLTEREGARLTALWRFGRLIANTDMHYGNVALMLGEALPLELAPCYDMLPMAYRPGQENRIPGPSEEMIARIRGEQEDPDVLTMAMAFWNKVAGSDLVSEEFRRIASLHASAA